MSKLPPLGPNSGVVILRVLAWVGEGAVPVAVWRLRARSAQKQTSTRAARQQLVEDGEVGSFKRAVVAATPNMYVLRSA
jgi:hypothetical protein